MSTWTCAKYESVFSSFDNLENHSHCREGNLKAGEGKGYNTQGRPIGTKSKYNTIGYVRPTWPDFLTTKLGPQRDQGRWEEAEQLDVQVMETRKTKLGEDHPNSLTSMNNLAHTLRSSSQYTAALQLMAECVQLRDRN
ncbi:hypothetical protein N7486_000494 [Penicillium sp. IBT 16267x]|nr:hypothetical protein N7486_000494 [Penicillium sp. IBT 16267x]